MAGKRNHKDSLDFFLIRARLRVLQSNRYQGWSDAADYFKNELKTATGYQAIGAHYGLAVAAQRMKNTAEALKQIEIVQKMAGENSAIINKLHSNLVFESSPENRSRGLQLAKSAQQKSPLSTMLVLNYGDLLLRDKKYNDLLNFLRRQHALSKSTVEYQSFLGQAYEALGKVSQSHQAIGEMYALQGQRVAAIQQLSLAQKANDGDFYTMSEMMLDSENFVEMKTLIASIPISHFDCRHQTLAAGRLHYRCQSYFFGLKARAHLVRKMVRINFFEI